VRGLGRDARPYGDEATCAGRVRSPDPTGDEGRAPVGYGAPTLPGMRDVRRSGTESRPYGDEGRAPVGHGVPTIRG